MSLLPSLVMVQGPGMAVAETTEGNENHNQPGNNVKDA
jgi:hypothetical protein